MFRWALNSRRRVRGGRANRRGWPVRRAIHRTAFVDRSLCRGHRTPNRCGNCTCSRWANTRCKRPPTLAGSFSCVQIAHGGQAQRRQSLREHLRRFESAASIQGCSCPGPWRYASVHAIRSRPSRPDGRHGPLSGSAGNERSHGVRSRPCADDIRAWSVEVLAGLNRSALSGR